VRRTPETAAVRGEAADHAPRRRARRAARRFALPAARGAAFPRRAAPRAANTATDALGLLLPVAFAPALRAR
jgi:hypothetical protein